MKQTLYRPLHGKQALRGELRYPKMTQGATSVCRNILMVYTGEGLSPVHIQAEDEIADELMQYNEGEYVSMLATSFKCMDKDPATNDLIMRDGYKVTDIDHNNNYFFDHQMLTIELCMEKMNCPEMLD